MRQSNKGLCTEKIATQAWSCTKYKYNKKASRVRHKLPMCTVKDALKSITVALTKS